MIQFYIPAVSFVPTFIMHKVRNISLLLVTIVVFAKFNIDQWRHPLNIKVVPKTKSKGARSGVRETESPSLHAL